MMLEEGASICIGRQDNHAHEYVKVIYIHPKRRFFVIERRVLNNNFIRETRYIGNRRGILHK